LWLRDLDPARDPATAPGQDRKGTS
jgi:phosphatidylinositol dimannoside acyltransferase